MNVACILHAYCVYTACIMLAYCLHIDCISLASACILPAYCWHITSCLHTACILPAYCLHSACVLLAHFRKANQELLDSDPLLGSASVDRMTKVILVRHHISFGIKAMKAKSAFFGRARPTCSSARQGQTTISCGLLSQLACSVECSNLQRSLSFRRVSTQSW